MSDGSVTVSPMPSIPAPAGAAELIAVEEDQPVRRRRGPLALLRLALPPFLLFAVVIGLWYLVSYKILDAERRFLLPPPHRIVTVAFLDRGNFEVLIRALGLSAGVAMMGLAVAAVLGIGLAVLMSQARWIERAVYPWAVVLQTIPVLALAPLIGFWFDFGLFSRTLVCVLIAIFPIISTTLFGLRGVERADHDLFTLYGSSRGKRLRKLEWPAALPAIFAGLRIAAGLSVIGAIVGDFFFQQGAPGIGSLLRVYTQRLSMEPLLTAVALTALFGVVFFTAFAALDRAVVGRWYGRTAR